MKLRGRIRNQGKLLVENLPESARDAATQLINVLVRLAHKVETIEERAAKRKAKKGKAKGRGKRKRKGKGKGNAEAKGKAGLAKRKAMRARLQAKRAAASE